MAIANDRDRTSFNFFSHKPTLDKRPRLSSSQWVSIGPQHSSGPNLIKRTLLTRGNSGIKPTDAQRLSAVASGNQR